MYTVIIIADLQETYETLCFKITSFYNFFYMERWPIIKKLLLAGACRMSQGLVTKHLYF